MFNHCKPYKCNIYRIPCAVLAVLLGIIYVSAYAERTSAVFPRIALLGDSMTWIGGDSCQNETGWSHYLKNSGVAGEIDVYARSGATWTNTKSTCRNPIHYSEILHDDNVIFNQAIRLIENSDTTQTEPDIIILFAGANDAWFASRRPGLYDEEDSNEKYTPDTDPADVTTLEKSIRLVCDILHYRFPLSTLLFVTPLQMSKVDAETIYMVSDIIEKTAFDKGYSVLRADKETGITHEQEASSPKFTYDGVHTNPEGAQILGDHILRFIISHQSALNQTNQQLSNLTTLQLDN